jgi:chloramphenicol-sensitive protein RarD
VLPLYFSAVTPFVTPLELLAHRLLWGLVFLSLTLTVAHRWGETRTVVRNRRSRWLLAASAALVATNWFVFLFGVSAGRVVETSLGYFLTPLVSILLGLLVFRERLRPAAWAGLVLSAGGIVYLVASVGAVPWIAVAIAFSFGLYGMVRKLAGVDGLVGLTVETLLLAPAALGYLLIQGSAGAGAVLTGDGWALLLLALSGPLTAVPMIFFGEATRRLTLSALGFLQYLLPTLQLLQAVLLLGEVFRPEQQVCFALIWAALALVTADSVRSRVIPGSDPRRRRRLTAGEVRIEWQERLPGWLQPFLTWLMGYPYPGQKPLLGNRPWWLAVLTPACALALGLALAFAVIEVGGWAWLALPVAWMMAINGARALQVHVCHQGVHDALSGDPATDRLVVEAVSTLLLLHDYRGYRADHAGIHHPHLAGPDDPDRLFTTEVMKIRPGADVRANRARFLAALVSPRAHALFLFTRLKANFIDCPAWRRLLSVAWLAAVFAALLISQKWQAFLLGCALPMTLLYQASAMCQFVTEHFWVRRRRQGQSAKEHYQSLLLNRHLGDPLPDGERKGLAWWAGWATWWARLSLYHLPVRLGILVADLPVHGAHHLWPLDRRWANAIYAYRQLADEAGTSPTEVVGGYARILCSVLESFREVQHEPGDRHQPATPSRRVLAVSRS